MGEYNQDEVDAPAALLNRLRYAAAARGERRLTGAAAKKILRDFSAVVGQDPGYRKVRPYYNFSRDPRVLGGYTGARESVRDPKPLSSVIHMMIVGRGWKEPIAVSAVLARWDQLLGEEIAQHAQPESFYDSTVTVRCDSTAWATHLKLLRGEILAMFARELGPGIVTHLVINGPQPPRWNHGKLSSRGGRGPRDTYG